MALTEANKDAVRNSWYEFKLESEVNGAKIYKSMFTQHPEYMPMFKKFKGRTLEELMGSSVLKSHVKSVVKAFNDLVENLDHPEVITEMMHTVIDDHCQYNITYQHYVVLLKDVLLGVLADGVGVNWTTEAQESWTGVLDLLLLITKARLDSK